VQTAGQVAIYTHIAMANRGRGRSLWPSAQTTYRAVVDRLLVLPPAIPRYVGPC